MAALFDTVRMLNIFIVENNGQIFWTILFKTFENSTRHVLINRNAIDLSKQDVEVGKLYYRFCNILHCPFRIYNPSKICFWAL